MERIYLSYKLRVEEFVDARIGPPMGLGPKVYLIFFGLCFSAFGLLVLALDHEIEYLEVLKISLAVGTSSVIFLLFFSSVLVPTLCQLMGRIEGKRFVEAGYTDTSRGYIFQEDKWIEIFDGRSAELKWSQIRRWRESDYSLVLSVGSSEVPIPKRACTDEQLMALRALLIARVGPPR